MEEIPDKKAHLVVTSPPYPMIKKWDYHFGKVSFGYQHKKLKKVWRECHRILIDGGIMCVNIGDATRSIKSNFCCYPNYAKTVIVCEKIGFTPLIPIHWKKVSNRPTAFLGSGFLPPNCYVSQDCEYIAIFRKGGLRKFKPKDKRRIKSSFTKKERDVWFSQTWTVPGARGARKTSAFPVQIPYRLIRMFSLINDLVVDPFCGTGTTGIVAKKLNRRFVGYDLGWR